MSRVLIVDDDVPLCELLEAVLQEEGYIVSSVHCGESALQYMEKTPVDLVLLDVMLPNLNGMQVARRICQRFATPILMLTALNDENSMLDGYQAGADQYIGKPFNVAELLMRIKAILRRVGLERQRQAMCSTVQTISDQLNSLPLTSTEAELLSYLVKNQGVVISKAELQTEVLKKELSPFDRNLDMHISNIRRKLVEAGLSKQHIKTFRGKGYSYLEAVNN
ncbi:MULTISPECIES: response regulator transcription factor [Vibrio]|jgi:DNA-binding response OmpR family regulator|uniref:DNA-binding response regulator n=1 Tax=Vibrio diabolicus TaxID=50719 RepID=A0A2L2KBL3_9VIBR|nr:MULTISPECIES: response regulator transcription factor [Vibrio]MCS0030031.1 response regulator transcription factor [Vibrio alginolyticus]MEA3483434.1 response regulator transcription factor [Pseudomonadota bacterium]RCW23117.1 DNA-binding response OmpR family regulator [Vibrio parahaemolyticus]AVH29298.1 DNA-binding response regulator [Vibrio diabolicus]KLE26341.1 chemotaxis protein CheY [Vibrio diabolicus]|eukprot:NODE_4910_length_1002_cov_2.307167_g4703_i0.p1 GENE.NODE_4910_length_1002_cov_2.307167_g4703_i0~~NODE_4910_length_1002_cov_2.307167_g4703_i0.p1  ORF type:complete len:222 (-),score=4.50 NODE_4910_length_1002_cov_2.307167_g4703_i0:97-762(-)